MDPIQPLPTPSAPVIRFPMTGALTRYVLPCGMFIDREPGAALPYSLWEPVPDGDTTSTVERGRFKDLREAIAAVYPQGIKAIVSDYEGTPPQRLVAGVQADPAKKVVIRRKRGKNRSKSNPPVKKSEPVKKAAPMSVSPDRSAAAKRAWDTIRANRAAKAAQKAA